MFSEKSYSEIFKKIQKKTPWMESFFTKMPTPQVFSCKISEHLLYKTLVNGYLKIQRNKDCILVYILPYIAKTTWYKSSHRKCYLKKCCWKFRKIHSKTPVPESLFNRVFSFIKKETLKLVFPMNFTKFLRPFSQNTSGQMLLLVYIGCRLNNSRDIFFFLTKSLDTKQAYGI